MLIKNITNSILEIKYYDRTDSKTNYALCLRPKGEFNTNNSPFMMISSVELRRLERQGRIQVLEDTPSQDYVLEDPKEVNTPESSTLIADDLPTQEENHEEVSQEAETLDIIDDENINNDPEAGDHEDSESHTCEICGREFASARGLSNHMKSHKE